MTEKRAKALHRAMWRWLALHPGKRKLDWPGWQSKNSEINNVFDYGDMCFACWIVSEHDDKNDTIKSCKGCPIAEKAGICNTGNDLWHKYLYLCLDYEFSSVINPPFDYKWADVCIRMSNAWREI